MERIGQAKSLFVPTKTEVWGTFRAAKKTNLAKKSAPCVTDPNYSYTQCMMDYVTSTVGCHLDWVHNANGDSDHEACTTWDQVGGGKRRCVGSFRVTKAHVLVTIGSLQVTLESGKVWLRSP